MSNHEITIAKRTKIEEKVEKNKTKTEGNTDIVSSLKLKAFRHQKIL